MTSEKEVKKVSAKRSTRKLTAQKVEDIKKQLTDMEESPAPKTLQDLVNLTCREISASLGKGYTYRELAQKLTDNGVKISAVTLGNYHRKAITAGYNELNKAENPALKEIRSQKANKKKASQKVA